MRAVISRIITGFITSRTLRDAKRFRAGLSRTLLGGRPVVEYFHQADDPYSHLVVQLLPRLADRYGLDLKTWIVSPPDDAAAPERDRLRALGLRDAPRLARAYGLSFPSNAQLPGLEALAAVNGRLAEGIRQPGFLDLARACGESLWQGQAISAGSLDAAEVHLKAGTTRRRQLGHYLGGMLYFEGEWYWGVDRLHHLESRLSGLGLDSRREELPLAPYRDVVLGPPPQARRRVAIDFWFSFRSPYTWIAFPRVRRLAHHYGVELRLRYILPMIMRGLPVPQIKSRYITFDTKRESETVDLPFGVMVDPVGRGVERALAVLYKAIPLGLGEVFAENALRASWAQGVDLTTDAGLKRVARASGLSTAQVDEALADQASRQTAEANRKALFDAGLWGAPSYSVNGLPAHWGQDRLWALEEDLLDEMTHP
ncbi:MAG: 2-hydroxychromene-2-carboxylate dehydrogenase [Phenylobacterium zucineum]|nr:MAG: 2-hydroxychromene-2-carboxylate dehydrogenase [Phenylobacterium zucineum]